MPAMEHLSTVPRTEAERVVLTEAGGSSPLGLSLILLMRAADMKLTEATAIARACRWAAIEGNVPDEFLGTFYREDLRNMLDDRERGL